MFGYFLRRVDRRFQLESSLGTLPMSKEDTVARLELLFSAVSDQTFRRFTKTWHQHLALFTQWNLILDSASGNVGQQLTHLAACAFEILSLVDQSLQAADQGTDDVNPDWAPALDVTPPGTGSPSSSGGGSSSNTSSPTSSSTPASGPPQGSSRDLPATKPKSALRKYVESFDQVRQLFDSDATSISSTLCSASVWTH